MRILIMTHRFLPFGDATTKCVVSLIQQFHRKNVQTDVVCATPFSSKKHGTFEGSHIFYSVVPGCADWEEFQKLKQSSPCCGVLCLVQKFIFILLQNIFPVFRAGKMRWGLYYSFKKGIKACCRHQHYDCIISTLAPVEAAWAGIRYCGKTPFYIYQLDPYTENLTASDSRKQARWRIEKELYEKAVRVFATPLICKEKQNLNFPGYNKCVPLEFPLVSPCRISNIRSASSSVIRCVFAGTLYPSIRPADDLIRIFSALTLDRIVLYCAGSGQNAIHIMPEYKNSPKRFQCLGRLPFQEAEELIQSADFLVNVDNKAINQVPSKIFEYISSCKPIINLYYNAHSPTLSYLKQYPLSLNLNCSLDPVEENVSLLQNFIQKNLGIRAQEQEIKESFSACTPEYVAVNILSSIAASISQTS